MKKFKTQKGITLVALVITIIVLLILAVVAIGAVRDSGVIGHAQNSADKYNTEKAKEDSLLGSYEDVISQYYSSKGNQNNKKYYDITFKDLTKITDWETLIPDSDDVMYTLWFEDKNGTVGVVGVVNYGGEDGHRVYYWPKFDFSDEMINYEYEHGNVYDVDENDIWMLEYPDGPDTETTAPEIKNVTFMTEDEIQEYCMNNMEFDEDEEIDENFKFKGNLYLDMTEEQKSKILNITEAGSVNTDGAGGGSGELGEEASILEKYIFGPDLAGRPMTDIIDMNDFSFKDDEKTVDIDETQTIGAKFITSAQASSELAIIYFESQGITYKFGINVNSYLTDKEYGVVYIYEPQEGTRVGKYVEDENGDIWRIIYDDATHGLQMISTNTFQYNNADFCLGSRDTLITDWTSINTATPEFSLADLNGNKSLDDNLEKSIYSYNQGVETLNTACENLFKENGNYTRTYIQDVRCVGSNPVFANKNSENTTTATSTNYPALATWPKNNASQAAGIADGKGYGTDNNFETDFDMMVALGINGSDKGYWLASRFVCAESHIVDFNVRCVSSDGAGGRILLWRVYETDVYGYDLDNTLRPVVSLRSNIQFAKGDGSKGNPYKFN